MDSLSPKPRDGGVVKVEIESGNASKLADDKMKTLGDIYGWLLEAEAAGEFAEAVSVFKETNALLDRLAGISKRKE